LDERGETKEDIKLPEDEWLKDISDKCKEIFADGGKECIVTVLSALGTEKIIAVREGKE
jgi:hypothetical protein